MRHLYVRRHIHSDPCTADSPCAALQRVLFAKLIYTARDSQAAVLVFGIEHPDGIVDGFEFCPFCGASLEAVHRLDSIKDREIMGDRFGRPVTRC